MTFDIYMFVIFFMKQPKFMRTQFLDQPFQVRGQGGEDEEALYETELVEVASDQEDEVH